MTFIHNQSFICCFAIASALVLLGTACSSSGDDDEAQQLPDDCYTSEASPSVPRDTNRYAIALLQDAGAGAGALDEYAHCKYLPVLRPPAVK